MVRAGASSEQAVGDVQAWRAGFKTACIVGGASYEVQKGKLRKGAEIVVATPGRLLDCLQKRYAVLNQCAYIVLDEADRMIDLGFEPQVIEVLAAMPASNMKPLDAEGDGADAGPTESMIQEGKLYRTTYMFSATMPIAVERIAKRYLRRPVTVVVGATGRAVDSVTQRIEWIERKQKPSALTRALDTFQTELEHSSGTDNDGFKIICFVNNRVRPFSHELCCVLPVCSQGCACMLFLERERERVLRQGAQSASVDAAAGGFHAGCGVCRRTARTSTTSLRRLASTMWRCCMEGSLRSSVRSASEGSERESTM